MLATLITSTLFASLVAAIHLTVNDTISQCDRITINYGGEGKLNVAVLNSDDECGDAIKEWLNVESGDVHWTANVTVGSQVVFLAEENDTDAEEWSKVYTIQSGSTDCLSTSTSDSGSSSSTAAGSGTTQTVSSTAGSGSGSSSSGGTGASNVESSPNSVSRSAAVSVLSVFGAALAASLF